MKISWKLKRTAPNQYQGIVILPLAAIPGKRAAGPLAIKATGSSAASALSKAANIADRIASNPIIASVLPPGSSVALKATKYLAKAAKVGKLADAASKVVGPGAKRLLKALKFW